MSLLKFFLHGEGFVLELSMVAPVVSVAAAGDTSDAFHYASMDVVIVHLSAHF